MIEVIAFAGLDDKPLDSSGEDFERAYNGRLQGCIGLCFPPKAAMDLHCWWRYQSRAIH